MPENISELSLQSKEKTDTLPKAMLKIQPTYDLGFFVSEGGVEEDLFDA